MSNPFFQIPMLPERPDLMAKFSTFFIVENFNDTYLLTWKQDLDLKRLIEKKIKQVPNSNILSKSTDAENFLINYCLSNCQQLSDKNLAENCLKLLKAYLEETRYWSVKEIFWGNKVTGETWYHAINIATLIINKECKNFIQKYNPNHSSEAKLDTFVKAFLKIRIQNEIGLISEWRLLFGKDTPKKYLKEALFSFGISQSEIKVYLYTWSYCKEVYLNNKINIPSRKKGAKWPKPEVSDFEETAKYCNENKNQSYVSWEVARYEIITANQIKDWMDICIKALRNFDKKFGNSDKKVSNPKKIKSKINDNNLSLFSEILLNGQDNVKSLKTYIENLNNNTVIFSVGNQKFSLKTVAILRYGLKFKQAFLAEKMNCNQSTISRNLLQNYQQPLVNFIQENINQKDKLYCNCFLMILQNISDPSNDKLNQVIKSFIQDVEIKNYFNLSEDKMTMLTIGKIFWGKISPLINKNCDRMEQRLQSYKNQVYEIIDCWFNEQLKNLVIYILENYFYEVNIYPVLEQSYNRLLLETNNQSFHRENFINKKDYLEKCLIDWFINQKNIEIHSEKTQLKSVITSFLKSLKK